MSLGAKGFDKKYWDHNYSDIDRMDCIGNAKEHVRYIHSLFSLEFIDINSIIDLGFGLGHLFEELLVKFAPYRAIGIEPSSYAFSQVNQRDICKIQSTKFKLYKESITDWCQKERKGQTLFDLGVCTSVLQYLSDEEIEEIVPILSRRIKYLYLSVPTNKELDRQIEELGNDDHYAYKRSRSKYQKLLRKNFTFISSRLLESRYHFDEKNTHFSDLLFRY